jgi:hypothetical protein
MAFTAAFRKLRRWRRSGRIADCLARICGSEMQITIAGRFLFARSGAAETVNEYGAGAVETKVFVEGDGASVGLGNVEEAALAGGTVEAEEMADEARGVSAAGVAGMGADGADLDDAWDGEALSGHGDELAIHMDAEVVAEDVGARAKEPGEGDVGEVDHGRRVVGVEGANDECFGTRVRLWRDGLGAVHLPARNLAFEGEAGDGGEGLAGDIRGFAGGEKVAEGGHVGGVRLRDAGEGEDIGGVAAGEGRADGEVGVLGDQRVPGRVEEEVLHGVFLRSYRDAVGSRAAGR